MKNIYRPEIDGLRALAVFPVILFHAGIEVFKGGFVGVDIFFVISGYLITTVILKDIEKKKFSLTYFYQRRARRILPALIIVIGLSLPIALYLLPPSDLKNFSKSIFSSLTFWSNFQFVLESGYFEVTGEYKPLLHTWSLSIEEQFYIFYPLLFILLFKIKKNFTFSFIFIILLSSLFFAQWGGNINSKFPFFDEKLLFYSQSYLSKFMMPFGRIWELAFGAICAFLIHSQNYNLITTHSKVNKILFFNIFSFFGLFLIFFSFFYLSKYFPYPSFYSIIPTLGTALLILFCTKETIVQKILSNQILVFIGLISYSAYLFHYPIFSFIKYISADIEKIIYIYAIPIILFISFLNWKFIEKPFRNPKTSIRKLIIFIGSSYLLLMAICLFIYGTNGLDKREKFSLPKNIVNSFSLPASGIKCVDINYIHKKENQDKICKIGNEKKKKIDFVVLGDSHVVSFYSMLDNLAKKNNKLGLFLGYSGCPPILNVYSLRSDSKERNCYELNKSVYEIIIDKKIKNLILISRWTYYTEEKYLQPIDLKPSRSSNEITSRNAFEKGFIATLEALKKQRTNIFVIQQPPQQNNDPKKIYYRAFDENLKQFNNNLIGYSLDLNQHNNLEKFVKRIFKKLATDYKNLTIIDLNDIFCDKIINKCLIGNDQYSFYSDRDHLSTKGVNLTTNRFSTYIEKF